MTHRNAALIVLVGVLAMSCVGDPEPTPSPEPPPPAVTVDSSGEPAPDPTQVDSSLIEVDPAIALAAEIEELRAALEGAQAELDNVPDVSDMTPCYNPPANMVCMAVWNSRN